MSSSKNPTHWTQCLPEAGKQINQQVQYIDNRLEQIETHRAAIKRLHTERVEAETKLLEEVEQHFTDQEIYEAKISYTKLMQEKEVNNA